MSWWTKIRDAVEHEAVTLATATAGAVVPELKTVAMNAGAAVIQAVASKGIAHGSDDAIAAAKASIIADAPHLGATVSTALAASVVAELHEAQQQAQDNPGQPPQPAG